MLDFFKEYGFVVGALTGSLAAYLLGLLVSHFRREKRWLGFAIDSRNIVRNAHSDISMSFKGQPINRLDAHTVLVKNLGNRSLTNIPVKISADQNTSTLEIKINRPEGVEVTLGNHSNSEVYFLVDILKQEESVSFDFTTLDSATGEVKLISRMADVHLVELSDRSVSAVDMIEVLSIFPFYGKYLSDIYKIIYRLRSHS